jgi:hypothetical protein
MHPNQIPDGHSEDDESAATEVAEPVGADHQPNQEDWEAIVNTLWIEYDTDKSGFIDRAEIVPLAKESLA